MQYTAKPTSRKISLKKRGRRKDMSIFEDLIHKYSQDQTTLDPTQLQVGQAIYDQSGEEYTILEDPEGTTNKVLMPTQQSGTTPQDVQTVEDTDLAAQYSLQPASGAQGATGATTARVAIIKKLDSGWGLYSHEGKLLGKHDTKEDAVKQEQAIKAKGGAREMIGGYADFLDSRYDDSSGLHEDTPSAEDFGSYNPGEGGEWSDSGKPYVPKFDPSFPKGPETKTKAPEMSGPLNPDDGKHKHSAVYGDIGGLVQNSQALQDEEAGLILGQSGYVDAMNDIKAMVDAGYQTIDVILNIGELYNRDFGQRVLAEARKKGIL